MMTSIGGQQLLLVTCVCTSLVLAAPSNSQNVKKDLDGVCKSSRIPAGYVPVKELQSAECESQDPFDKNAWLVDRVRDGSVSCQPIDYSEMYAPLAYVVCERVHTEDCPTTPDGAANGYVLRLPQLCRDAKTEIGCHQPQGICSDDGGLKFLRPSQRVGASRPVDFLERVIVSKGVKGANLEPRAFGDLRVDEATAEKLVYRRIDAGDYVPACIDYLDRSINYSSDAWLSPSWTPVLSIGRNARSGLEPAPVPRKRNQQDMTVIVRAVRRFHDPACPSDVSQSGTDLNAVVLARGLSESEIGAMQVFACPMSDGFHGRYAPGVSSRFHDDRCGVSNGANAVRVELTRY